MYMAHRRPSGQLVTLSALIAASVVIAGCSSSKSKTASSSSPSATTSTTAAASASAPAPASAAASSPADAGGAPVTITVGDFGTFGYKEAGLYAAYSKLHPNVTIKEDLQRRTFGE